MLTKHDSKRPEINQEKLKKLGRFLQHHRFLCVISTNFPIVITKSDPQHRIRGNFLKKNPKTGGTSQQNERKTLKIFCSIAGKGINNQKCERKNDISESWKRCRLPKHQDGG